MYIRWLKVFVLVVFVWAAPTWATQTCGSPGVWLQVLGSGGPELLGGRASSGYLLWSDGKVRVMVDAGAGTALRFGSAGADFADLDVLVFSHLHVDHSNDLPALVKASFFGDRDRDLPIFGPAGNWLMPSTERFVSALFDAHHGVYPYLSEYIDPGANSGYKLRALSIPIDTKKIWSWTGSERVQLQAVPVHHGPIPALAWRVHLGHHSIVFSGDMNGANGTLAELARGADLLLAHNAVPEGASGVARNLHMPPSEIGRIAAAAGVKQLILSHRMMRTLGREDETVRAIRETYQEPVAFADDLDCFKVGD